MKKKRVAILISGSGSNMEALVKATLNKDFPAEFVVVISDNESAKGIEKAKAMSVPIHVIKRDSFSSKEDFEVALLQCLKPYAVDLICLAGFMRLLSRRFIEPYQDCILNIHPSLLPLFPGLNTHARAIAAGVKITGCTIHLVNESMDGGRILAQAAVPVLPNDTEFTLSERVLSVEHQLYAKALKAYIEGKAPSICNADYLLSF